VEEHDTKMKFIGFTQMDDKDGYFTFDLVIVRVNVLQDEIVWMLEDEEQVSETEREFRQEAAKERKCDKNDDLVTKHALQSIFIA
jgi:hypothetical protein